MTEEIIPEILPPSILAASPALPVPSRHQTVQQVQTQYVTALSVQRPRELATCQKRLLEEARLAGDEFYYAWGAGQNHIEGASVDLAVAAARCWGNCATEMGPIQETSDAWIMTALFIDLETGFTLARQFRQSKRYTVHGKLDDFRKEDMRFAIGQSKAVRNVILQAMPKHMIRRAIEEAKQGIRERIEKFVESNGLVAAVDHVLKSLGRHAIKDEQVLAKCAVANRNGLTVDHIIVLRGCLHAIDSGQERAEDLFPQTAEQKKAEGKERVDELAAKASAPPDPQPEAAYTPEPAKKSGKKPAAKPPTSSPMFSEELNVIVEQIAKLASKEQLSNIFSEYQVPSLYDLTVAQANVVLGRLQKPERQAGEEG